MIAPVATFCLLFCVSRTLGRSEARNSCAPVQGADFVLESNPPQPHFYASLSSRICALRSSHLERPIDSVALDSGASTTWTVEALLLTAALTHAYSNDHGFLVDARTSRSFGQSSASCKLMEDCFFDTSSFEAHDNQAAVWTAAKLQAHYLRGAGLLWLRERTVSYTGCDLAAILVTSLLRPSDDLAAAVNTITSQFGTAKSPIVFLNGHSLHMDDASLTVALDAVPRGNTVWVVGMSGQAREHALALSPGVRLREIEFPPGMSASAQSVLMAFAISFSGHYIGDLDPAWVKIGLLLRLGRSYQFPKISSGSSKWKDDYGFASCTAEEYRAHTRSMSGAILFSAHLRTCVVSHGCQCTKHPN